MHKQNTLGHLLIIGKSYSSRNWVKKEKEKKIAPNCYFVHLGLNDKRFKILIKLQVVFFSYCRSIFVRWLSKLRNLKNCVEIDCDRVLTGTWKFKTNFVILILFRSEQQNSPSITKCPNLISSLALEINLIRIKKNIIFFLEKKKWLRHELVPVEWGAMGHWIGRPGHHSALSPFT